ADVAWVTISTASPVNRTRAGSVNCGFGQAAAARLERSVASRTAKTFMRAFYVVALRLERERDDLLRAAAARPNRLPPRPVQGAGRAAADRLDRHREREGRAEPRALQLLQRLLVQSADRRLLQRGREGLVDLRHGDRRVRLEHGDLGLARPDERERRLAAARRERVPPRRSEE